MSSSDPGQMFHISDWYFDDMTYDTLLNSTALPLDLPILPHDYKHKLPPFLNPFPRFLKPRATSGFACPDNTSSCASIGADYGCCPQGTTCQLGDKGSLGCCPGSAGTCAGNTPTNCAEGYISCPLFREGGGCCAKGFECQSQGCVGVSTTVVVVYPTITATRSSSTSIPASSPATTTTTTSISTTASQPPSTSPSTSTSTSTTLTEPQTTPIVPIAPASLSTTTSTTSLPPTTLYIDPCPTGYYACSAYFNLGSCCQVGRNCGRTSCPPLITATTLISNGVTIAGISASNLCATGWTTCAAGIGGGCCPSGYGCGAALCSATATASAEASLGSIVAKQGSSAGKSLTRQMKCVVGVVSGLIVLLSGMI